MSDWLIRRERRPKATHRMYCFPFAGGSAGEFLRWEQQLPDVEIWGVLPPGRGRRLDEPPYTSATELVTALLSEVDFAEPFILFGHSLGALLAYETARALRDTGRALPTALIASAHRPPDEPQVDEHIHDLPDAAFQAAVAERYPPPPEELAEDPEFLGGLHRMLRADLAVFETYRPVPTAPLSCPIIVLCGREDHWSADELAGWGRATTAGCAVHLLDGGHFYLPDHPEEAIGIIAEHVERTTSKELAGG